MISELLLMVFHALCAVVAAGILVGGFVFAILLGDANARGHPLFSARIDKLAAPVFYLAWFGLLWQFGVSRLLVMVACAAAVALCVIYAASYQASASKRPVPSRSARR